MKSSFWILGITSQSIKLGADRLHLSSWSVVMIMGWQLRWKKNKLVELNTNMIIFTWLCSNSSALEVDLDSKGGKEHVCKHSVNRAKQVCICYRLFFSLSHSLSPLSSSSSCTVCPGCFDFAAGEWQSRPHLTPSPASADVSILQQIGACNF